MSQDRCAAGVRQMQVLAAEYAISTVARVLIICGFPTTALSRPRNTGPSKNLVVTPVSVFNHGTHRRPHSRDTEGCMKETFGQLAEIRPSPGLVVFRQSNAWWLGSRLLHALICCVAERRNPLRDATTVSCSHEGGSVAPRRNKKRRSLHDGHSQLARRIKRIGSARGDECMVADISRASIQ